MARGYAAAVASSQGCYYGHSAHFTSPLVCWWVGRAVRRRCGINGFSARFMGLFPRRFTWHGRKIREMIILRAV